MNRFTALAYYGAVRGNRIVQTDNVHHAVGHHNERSAACRNNGYSAFDRRFNGSLRSFAQGVAVGKSCAVKVKCNQLYIIHLIHTNPSVRFSSGKIRSYSILHIMPFLRCRLLCRAEQVGDKSHCFHRAAKAHAMQIQSFSDLLNREVRAFL